MIDATARVTESTIADSARIYKNAIVRKSFVGENCIIGDLGHVEDSRLDYFTQLYPFGTI